MLLTPSKEWPFRCFSYSFATSIITTTATTTTYTVLAQPFSEMPVGIFSVCLESSFDGATGHISLEPPYSATANGVFRVQALELLHVGI